MYKDSHTERVGANGFDFAIDADYEGKEISFTTSKSSRPGAIMVRTSETMSSGYVRTSFAHSRWDHIVLADYTSGAAHVEGTMV